VVFLAMALSVLSLSWQVGRALAVPDPLAVW